MASVFLSYDRDDADRAPHFAHALEKAGHEVWWDLHVRGGAQFSKVIEEALKAADVVVVLWSQHSVESAWVRDEATAGRDTGRLVPVTIDGTEPPLGFRQFQTIDLSRWRGRGTPPQLKTLLADVESMAPAGGQRQAPSAPLVQKAGGTSGSRTCPGADSVAPKSRCRRSHRCTAAGHGVVGVARSWRTAGCRSGCGGPAVPGCCKRPLRQAGHSRANWSGEVATCGRLVGASGP